MRRGVTALVLSIFLIAGVFGEALTVLADELPVTDSAVASAGQVAEPANNDQAEVSSSTDSGSPPDPDAPELGDSSPIDSNAAPSLDPEDTEPVAEATIQDLPAASGSSLDPSDSEREDRKNQRKLTKKTVQSFAIRAEAQLSEAAEAALITKITALKEQADLAKTTLLQDLASKAESVDTGKAINKNTKTTERETLQAVNDFIAEDFEQSLSKELSAAELQAVEWVEPDLLFALQDAPNDPRYSEQWGLQFILGKDSLPAPAAVANDQRTIVAVIDTGIDYMHSDLAGQFWTDPDCVSEAGEPIAGGCLHGGYDFVDNDTDPLPTDGYTHATSVAGIIAARTDNATGIASLSNGSVQIMSLRACCGTAGYFGSDSIARAIHFAVRNGASVINASFGGPTYSKQLFEAFQFAAQHGVLVVAAAGNYAANNDTTPIYPANFDLPNILSVAALQLDGALASFSNFGRETVDLAAPGLKVISTKPGNTYSEVSGTSFAAPFVTSLAGRYFFADAAATFETICTRLLSGSTPLPSLSGFVRGGKALTLTDHSSPVVDPLLEPPLIEDSQPGNTEVYRNRSTHEITVNPDGTKSVKYRYQLRGLPEADLTEQAAANSEVQSAATLAMLEAGKEAIPQATFADQTDLQVFDAPPDDGKYLKFGTKYYGPIQTKEDLAPLAVEFADKSAELRLQEMERATTLSGAEFQQWVTAGGTVGEEQLHMRNEYTKVQKMLDGQYYAEMSLSPQFFQNNAGQFWSVNSDIHDLRIPTVIPQDKVLLSAAQTERYLLSEAAPATTNQYDYGVLASNVKYLFRDEQVDYAYALTEVSEQSFLHFVPLGMARGSRAGFLGYTNVAGEYAGNSVKFAELLPGVSHRHTLVGNQRQQEITLAQRPELLQQLDVLSFGVTLQLPHAARIFTDGNERRGDFTTTGLVEIRTADETFTLTPPVANDSGVATLPASTSYRFERLPADEWLVSIEVDAKWLNAAQRIYPVTISTTTRLELASDPLSTALQADNGSDPNRQSNCQYTAVDVITGIGRMDMREEKNWFSNAFDTSKWSFKTGFWYDSGTQASYYKKGIVGLDLTKLPGFRSATNISNGQLLLWHNGAIGFPSGGLPFGLRKIRNSFHCDTSKWANLSIASSWTDTARTISATPPSGNIIYYNINSDLAAWASSGLEHFGYAVDITDNNLWSSGQSWILATDYAGTQRYPHIRVVYTPADPASAKPDIAPYTPSGWHAPLVLRTDANAPKSSSVTTVPQGSTLYLDYAFANLGTADAAWQQARIYIGGTEATNCGRALLAGQYLSCATTVTINTPGTYAVELRVDADNHAIESNESNNTYSAGSITVTAADLPDLSPASDPVFIRNASGQRVNTIEFGQPVSMEAIWQNTGSVTAGTHTAKVYIGSDEAWSCRLSSLSAGGVTSCAGVLTTLHTSILPGTHALKLRIDAQGEVPEKNETNNDVTLGSFTIVSNINLAPYTPTGWQSSFIASHNTNATASSTLFEVNQPIYLSFGYQNTGTGTIGLTQNYLKIGTQHRKTFERPLAGGERAVETNYNFSPLATPGSYTIYLELDAPQQLPEASEADNTLAHQLTVLSALESNVLKVTSISQTSFVAGRPYDVILYGAKFYTTSGMPNVTQVSIAGRAADFTILSPNEIRLNGFVLPAGGTQTITIGNATDTASLQYTFTLADNPSLGTPDLALQNVVIKSQDSLNSKNWNGGTLTVSFEVVNRGGVAAADTTATVLLCSTAECDRSTAIANIFAIPALAANAVSGSQTAFISSLPSWFTVGSEAYAVISVAPVAGETHTASNKTSSRIVRQSQSIATANVNCDTVNVYSILAKSTDSTAGENYAELTADVKLFFDSIEQGELPADQVPEIAKVLASRVESWRERAGASQSLQAEGSDALGLLATGLGELAELSSDYSIQSAEGVTESIDPRLLASFVYTLQHGERSAADQQLQAVVDPRTQLQNLLPQAGASPVFAAADPLTSPAWTEVDWLASLTQTEFTSGTAVEALATELQHDPVQIYAWVQREIRQLPYRGTAQGAAACLTSRQCNDADTAHLLVGLLRASGIPARYRTQSVRLPESRLLSLFGVTSSADLPAAFAADLVLGNGFATIPLVLAEAYLPTSAASGGGVTAAPLDLSLTATTTNAEVQAALATGPARIWLPLLPIDKTLTVTLADYFIADQPAVASLTADYLNTSESISPLDWIEQQLGDLSGYLPSITQHESVVTGIPLGIPGYLTGTPHFSATHGESPQVVVHLRNSANETVWSTAVSLLSLTDHQLTLDYAGATPAAEAYIVEHGSLFLTPAPDIQLVPVLRTTSAAELARGSTPLVAGEQLTLTLSLTKGDRTLATEQTQVLAGNELGIAALAYLVTPDPEAHLSQGLSAVAHQYLAQLMDERANTAHLYQQAYLPTAGVALVSTRLDTLEQGGQTLALDLTGYFLAGDLSDSTYPLGRTLDAAKQAQLKAISELAELHYSTTTLEDLTAMTVVSPLRVLQRAATTGIELDHFTSLSEAYYGSGDLPVTFRNLIDELLLHGYEVYLTRKQVTFDTDHFVALVARDPATGELLGQHYLVRDGVLVQGFWGDVWSNVKSLWQSKELVPSPGKSEQVCKLKPLPTAPVSTTPPPLPDSTQQLCYTDSATYGRYTYEPTRQSRYSIYVDSRSSLGKGRSELGTVSKTDIDNYRAYISRPNGDKCHAAGVPIRDKRNYKFGEVDHSFWQWSGGGKFYSNVKIYGEKNKFDEDEGYAASSSELKNLVLNRGVPVNAKFQTTPDIQLGTFYYTAGEACPSWQPWCAEQRYYLVPPNAASPGTPTKAVLLAGDFSSATRQDDLLTPVVRNALTSHGYGLHGWLLEDYGSVNTTLGSFLGYPVADATVSSYHSRAFGNSYVSNFLGYQAMLGGGLYCSGEKMGSLGVAAGELASLGCRSMQPLLGKLDTEYHNLVAALEGVNLSATQANLLTQKIIDKAGVSRALTYNLDTKASNAVPLTEDLMVLLRDWESASIDEKESLQAGIVHTWIEQGESRLLFAAGFGAAGTLILPKLLEFAAKKFGTKLTLTQVPLVGWVLGGLDAIELIGYDWDSVNKCRYEERYIDENGLIDFVDPQTGTKVKQLPTYFCGRAIGELTLILAENGLAAGTAKGTLVVQRSLLRAQNKLFGRLMNVLPEGEAMTAIRTIQRELKNAPAGIADELARLGELPDDLLVAVLQKNESSEIIAYIKSPLHGNGKLPEFVASGSFKGAIIHALNTARLSWLPNRSITGNWENPKGLIGVYEKTMPNGVQVADTKSVLAELEFPKADSSNFKTISKDGYKMLNTPKSYYVEADQFWIQYNKPWLDDLVSKKADIVVLSDKSDDLLKYRWYSDTVTNLPIYEKIPNTNTRVKTGFGEEIEYMENLIQQGKYQWDAIGGAYKYVGD